MTRKALSVGTELKVTCSADPCVFYLYMSEQGMLALLKKEYKACSTFIVKNLTQRFG